MERLTSTTGVHARQLSWASGFALSLFLATLSFASRWLLEPHLPPEIFILASLVLVVPWFAILRASLRAYGRRGLWLLAGAPLALFWPGVVLLAYLVCLLPGYECM